ncbi:MAG: hypothetical protein M1837_001822 [Sclerophora amabilis]|nr:MAG: hypothetical protein M1837_001822 [Sclerophora amabilis]
MSSNVSHGRGGTGNIGPDTNTYVDGEIVREGPQASTGTGPTSTGRGGQGNIGAPATGATLAAPQDVVPEAATRPSQENQSYHVGRGGEGNVHHADKDKYEHEGLADKLKRKIFGDKKAQPESKPAKPVSTARGVPPIKKTIKKSGGSRKTNTKTAE